ncbi:caprin-2 isoform X3 [Polypterus senegalus]|uniref:caprin-2 isoform X3 n=1 Tax=Polypterus senegalus TaxID=55291 RepID=UPI001965817C|nr:caprin-2 isoform X3 [Polypterus senegalus]
MVQLSPSPVLCLPTPDKTDEKMRVEEKQQVQQQQQEESPKLEQQIGLSSLQLALSTATTTYQGYDTYIEDGLICLKHKIRNIEKKKLKLEDYTKRLNEGETLNTDQMEAVQKYDEVLHNLKFAKELHKTFNALSQDLLKAQKKAVRREQVMKTEAEKKRLRTIFQVQFVLQSLEQEHVKKDFRSGLNGAFFLSAKELDFLIRFSKMASLERNECMSLEDQMDQAAICFWELLEGNEKAVAGTTYKHLKDQLARLLDCGYFDHIPAPHNEMPEEEEKKGTKNTVKLDLSTKITNETTKQLSVSEPSVPTPQKNDHPIREFINRHYKPETEYKVQEQSEKSWKTELSTVNQEPPDSWEMQLLDDESPPPQPTPPKQWRAAATLVPKDAMELKGCISEPKPKRGRKPKAEQEVKIQPQKRASSPIAVFNSPSSIPKDPLLRKEKLQDLMAEIQGSFSFMQDSDLDSESSPNTKPLSQSSVLAASTPRAPRELKLLPPAIKTSPSTIHTSGTPKTNMINGERALSDFEMDLATEEAAEESLPLETEPYVSSSPVYQNESNADSALESPQVASCSLPPTVSQGQVFSSPPTSNHTISITTSPFKAMQTVFKVDAPLPPRESELKSDTVSYQESCSQTYSTASTQTPPQCSILDQTTPVLESVTPVTSYQSDSPVSNGCHGYLSPGQTNTFPRSNQAFYNGRGAVRGTVRGGRGLTTNSYRSPSAYKAPFEGYRGGVQSPSGNYIQPYPGREYTTMLYGSRETSFQQNYKRGSATIGQRTNSRAGWSDSSQVSSPERDNETFNSIDSGQGDSRCLTPVDMPVTSQAAALLPVHVYPLPQQMRVAFSAARTSNFAPGTLDQPIVFDLLLNNLGETFDMQMGRFSCPVSGTYVFIFHMLKLAVNVPLYVNLMKNEEVLVSAYANDGAPDHETASNHAVLQLFQGDQIWLRLHRGAIYGSSWKYSTFSGYLLYQD